MGHYVTYVHYITDVMQSSLQPFQKTPDLPLHLLTELLKPGDHWSYAPSLQRHLVPCRIASPDSWPAAVMRRLACSRLCCPACPLPFCSAVAEIRARKRSHSPCASALGSPPFCRLRPLPFSASSARNKRKNVSNLTLA